MTLVKVEIDLQKERPVTVTRFPVVKESKRMVYYADRKKKTPSALYRTSLGKTILVSPIRAQCFVLSFYDDRESAENGVAVMQAKMEILADMEAAMQRCAVRLNEQMEEIYAYMEG